MGEAFPHTYKYHQPFPLFRCEITQHKKAGDNGIIAGSRGYSYLYEPWWWAEMITMILGEMANFAAYAYAPAILVTPLKALKHHFQCTASTFYFGREVAYFWGAWLCCLRGGFHISIVLHAPHEKAIESVKEVWYLATEPGMNQFKFFETWFFTVVLIACCLLQINYLNKDWESQNASQIATEVCGFITILTGTFLSSTRQGIWGILPPKTHQPNNTPTPT